MATLFQIGKYGAINTTDMTTMGYYMIKLFSESRKLQEDTPCDGKIITYGELICQSTLHELCAILYKGEMGTKTTTKKNNFPDMQNCTSMSRCNVSNWGEKNT